MDNKIDVRPWGHYEILEERQNYKAKYICVNPKEKLSYQSHTKRAEHWFIISGTAEVTVNDKKFLVKPGDSVDIKIGEKHRIESGDLVVEFIEVQTGTYFGEDDITRYEDAYGRE
jgi:mannose-1-phosphate guanylyltransferase/mannose-1-phosphate guanylyltransferase/mannose-6-phosphate isomerase